MRVDFYHLSRDPAEVALPLIARQVIKAGERLLAVSADSGQLERISRGLWSLSPEAFLANGLAGAGHEERQPILLSQTVEALNGARYLAIADGLWREDHAGFERIFFLFGDATIQPARQVWSMLRKVEGVERHFWKQEGGRWTEAG